jgi:hypothetical protein
VITGQVLRAASRAAYVAAAANLLAALALLLLLRPGLAGETGGPEQRLGYVVASQMGWWLGWLTWHAAAIALLAFYVGLATVFQQRAPLRCGHAVLCGAAGLAVDLGAQAIFMGVAPRLNVETFALLEQVVGVLTGYLGNGLYTLAGILLVWAGSAEIPRGLVLLSLLPWIAGVGLSVASLLQFASGQFWSTALLMPAFILWTALMGRWLAVRAS